MCAKRISLGRNLDALLGKSAVKMAEPSLSTESNLKTIAIEKLIRSQYQPRQEINKEALQELADSIKAQGIIQPIVVRAQGNQYEIIAGERRWRAAQLAGLHEVPVVIRELPDESVLAMALIENIQREDLNPMDQARAMKRLLDEFSLTHEQLAEAVGKSRVTVTNLLRLMNLHEDVKRLLEKGQIEMGHARALLSLPSNLQCQIARQVVGNHLSVRETEKFVRHALKPNQAKSTPQKSDPNLIQFQNDLSEKLSAKVIIQSSRGGKGKLVIHYNDLDELEGIARRIR